MSTVGAYEAKTHLAQLLDRVDQGEQVTITRHGRPVAVLIPASEAPRTDRKQTIEDLKLFRRGRTLGPGVTIKQIIEEGRRS